MAFALALLSGSAVANPPVPADPWFGRDKALHFTATTVISGGGYGLTALATDKRWLRLAVGFGSAVAVGATKEGVDALGRGDPSWRDMTWNAIGAATGTLIAWGLDRWLSHEPVHPPPTQLRSPSASPVVWTVARQ